MKNFNQDICHHSHSFVLDNVIRRMIQKPGKIVGDYIQQGNTVVDIGCGPGFFTVEMARMVGETGSVVAVDLQPEMLEKAARKAARNKLADRIVFHRCAEDTLGLDKTGWADFVLAYYMLHETPDPDRLLREVKSLLSSGGRFLIVEPRFHVSESLFQEVVRSARDIGFTISDFPEKKGGRSLLLSV